MSQINTNTIANELGTGGPDFVGMPSVGGDPVVESGSNTDGEWTRWADGTQICLTTNLSMGVIDTVVGSLYRSNDSIWTFPASFVSGEIVIVGSGKDINTFSTVAAQGSGYTNIRQWFVSTITEISLAQISAQGRWK